MRRHETKLFLEKLQTLGLLNAEQAARAAALIAEEPTLLAAEAVRDVRNLSEDEFLKLLCEEYGSEYIDADMLRRLPIDQTALDLLSSQQAHELAVYPLHYDPAKQRLLVVTAYPFNPHTLAELDEVTGVPHVEVTFATEAVLGELIRRGYVGAEAEPDLGDDSGFEIGAGSDEEAFPGIYGSSVADYLYAVESPPSEDEEDSATATMSGVRGSLADLGLADMMQALSHSRKTCAVMLEHEDWHGTVYMEDGLIVHAETPDAVGAEAAYRIFAQQDGWFEILPRRFKGKPTLSEPVEALLLEAMRRMDEANR